MKLKFWSGIPRKMRLPKLVTRNISSSGISPPMNDKNNKAGNVARYSSGSRYYNFQSEFKHLICASNHRGTQAIFGYISFALAKGKFNRSNAGHTVPLLQSIMACMAWGCHMCILVTTQNTCNGLIPRSISFCLYCLMYHNTLMVLAADTVVYRISWYIIIWPESVS